MIKNLNKWKGLQMSSEKSALCLTIILIFLMVIFFLPACGENEKSKTNDEQATAEDDTKNAPGMEPSKDMDTQKRVYLERTGKALENYARELQRMMKVIKFQSSQIQTETTKELTRILDDLGNQHDAAVKQLAQLKSVVAHQRKYEEQKRKMGTTMADLQQAFEKARPRFKE